MTEDAASARLVSRDPERDLGRFGFIAAQDRDGVEPVQTRAELAAGNFPIENQWSRGGGRKALHRRPSKTQ